MNEPHERQDVTDSRDSGTAARRDAMLRELTAAMQNLHQRRRRRKRIAATLTLMLLLGGVLVLALPRQTTQQGPQQGPQLAHETQPQIQPSPEEQTRRVEIILVGTDPDIMQRYAANDAPRLVQMIDDDELLAALAAIDRPTGIIRTPEAVWLTAAVTDEELSRNGEHDRRGRSIF